MPGFITHPASYLGLFAFLVLTGCGMPIPEEVALVLAGVLSAQGKLHPQWAFAVCLAGCLVGDAVMYSIGRRFGHHLISAHPKLAHFLGADREADFEEALVRHGFKVLLISRFLVGVRGPVYLAAGAVRLPFRKFLLWDLVAATLVVGVFFSVSYYFGEHVAQRLSEAERTATLVVLAVAAIAALWLLYHNRSRLADRLLGASDASPKPGKPDRDAKRDKNHSTAGRG